MKVGITGTREGCTPRQMQMGLNHMLDNCTVDEVHHGDCVGVDAQMARLFKHVTKIVSHPPLDDRFRAGVPYDVLREPKEYLERDRGIVDECDILFAFPKEFDEVKRSGTWYTVRYAKKIGVPGVIFYPDGQSDHWGEVL